MERQYKHETVEKNDEHILCHCRTIVYLTRDSLYKDRITQHSWPRKKCLCSLTHNLVSRYVYCSLHYTSKDTSVLLAFKIFSKENFSSRSRKSKKFQIFLLFPRAIIKNHLCVIDARRRPTGRFAATSDETGRRSEAMGTAAQTTR